MAQADAFSPTELTTPTRYPSRAGYRKQDVFDVLDEALHCTVSFVRDGRPASLPTMHARSGETIYVHGSTGSRFALQDGEQACISVTLVDGLVLARSWFHHSVAYRSVVAHGNARLVLDPEERLSAMRALIDKMYPGRSAESRPPTRKEDAATAILAVELDEVSLKSRGGQVADDAEDLDGPHWAGTIPVSVLRGTPIPAEDLPAGFERPAPLECTGRG